MYIHNKAMTEVKKCSRCRSEIELKYFGINRKGEPYKTCDNCRNKKKIVKVTQEVCKDKTFSDYYINLPIFKFENKQDIDIRIDSIVVLNHNVEFYNNIIFRSDGKIWKYKELAELDPIEYSEGTDSNMDYMPDEYAAPVLIKLNGITHRASVLTWFALTDFADAIKWKDHVTKRTTYPIHIEKGKVPFHAVRDAIVRDAIGKRFWKLLPPTVLGYQIKEIKNKFVKTKFTLNF
jgi:hypothetical protein